MTLFGSHGPRLTQSFRFGQQRHDLRIASFVVLFLSAQSLAKHVASLCPRRIPISAAMATDAPAPAAPPAAADQDINPWSVQGGVDENGEVVAIDYEAISRCVWSASGGQARERGKERNTHAEV